MEAAKLLEAVARLASITSATMHVRVWKWVLAFRQCKFVVYLSDPLLGASGHGLSSCQVDMLSCMQEVLW